MCLTWERTYACNLSCIHCLSNSGRRDPHELSTAECKRLIDERDRLQVFYVNIGGGERTVRGDLWELVDYTAGRGSGSSFGPTLALAGSLRRSRKHSPPATMSTCRCQSTGQLPRSMTRSAVPARLRQRSRRCSISPVRDSGASRCQWYITRQNDDQLQGSRRSADRFDAQLRPTRLRPSGRGAAVWHQLHPSGAQQREVYERLLEHGEEVLTGDSIFYLPAYGQPLPGLNLCGASRVVCLIDPVGDVYACPLAIHDALLAGQRQVHASVARV